MGALELVGRYEGVSGRMGGRSNFDQYQDQNWATKVGWVKGSRVEGMHLPWVGGPRIEEMHLGWVEGPWAEEMRAGWVQVSQD